MGLLGAEGQVPRGDLGHLTLATEALEPERGLRAPREHEPQPRCRLARELLHERRPRAPGSELVEVVEDDGDLVREASLERLGQQ